MSDVTILLRVFLFVSELLNASHPLVSLPLHSFSSHDDCLVSLITLREWLQNFEDSPILNLFSQRICLMSMMVHFCSGSLNFAHKLI